MAEFFKLIMLAFLVCSSTPAGVRSSGLVVVVVLSLMGELSLCSCETAVSSRGDETADQSRVNQIADLIQGNETDDQRQRKQSADISHGSETADLRQGNETADQSQVHQTADQVRGNEIVYLIRGNQPADRRQGDQTADLNRRKQSVDHSQGKKMEWIVNKPFRNSTLQNFTNYTFLDEKVAEKRLKELTERSNRLRKELEKGKLPGAIAETFIDINTLLDDMFELMKEHISKQIMQRLKQQEEVARALRDKARKKLFIPMSEQIDSLLEKLNKLVKSVERKDRKKVRVYMYKLEQLRRDFQRLSTSDQLYDLRNKVVQLVLEINKLKTAKKDKKIAKEVERSSKWLSSGISYYIFRYSVWLLPNAHIIKFSNAQQS